MCCHCHSTSAHSRSPPRPLRSSRPLADDISFVLDCRHTTHQGRTNPSAADISSPRPWPRPSHILDSRLHASELPTRRCDYRTLVARRSCVNTGQGWPLSLLCQVLFFFFNIMLIIVQIRYVITCGVFVLGLRAPGLSPIRQPYSHFPQVGFVDQVGVFLLTVAPSKF